HDAARDAPIGRAIAYLQRRPVLDRRGGNTVVADHYYRSRSIVTIHDNATRSSNVAGIGHGACAGREYERSIINHVSAHSYGRTGPAELESAASVDGCAASERHRGVIPIQ